MRCDATPIADRPRPLRAALARHPIDDRDLFLYHKTTIRTVYEDALRLAPDADAVILWNARGEITEAADANVVVEVDGRKVTPPVVCGLLPGVQRAALLAAGEIVERRVTIDELRSTQRVTIDELRSAQRVSSNDLRAAPALWLINSVRGWMPATLCFTRGASPLGLPDIRLRAQRYGETSPKLEDRRRALSRSPLRRLAPFAWLAREARSRLAANAGHALSLGPLADRRASYLGDSFYSSSRWL